MDAFDQGKMVGRDQNPKNYYKVLEIDQSATRAQVREAFLRLKKTYSSSSQALYSLMNEEDARKSFTEIEEAFRVLDDDYMREKYDHWLKDQDGLAGGDLLHEPVARVFDPHPAHDAGESLRKLFSLAKVAGVIDEEKRQTIACMLDEGGFGDGSLYGRVREFLAVPLQEVQNHTKICREYLEAIEANRFDRLPPIVYVRGFLRSYLLYIGVPDIHKHIDAFARKFKEWQSTQQE